MEFTISLFSPQTCCFPAFSVSPVFSVSPNLNQRSHLNSALFSLLLSIFPWSSSTVNLHPFLPLRHCPPKPSEFVSWPPLPPSSRPVFPLTVIIFLTYSFDCASTAQILIASHHPPTRWSLLSLLKHYRFQLSDPLPICPTLCLATLYHSPKCLLNSECSLGCVICLYALPASWDRFLNMVCPMTLGLLLLWSYPSLPKANQNAHCSVLPRTLRRLSTCPAAITIFFESAILSRLKVRWWEEHDFTEPGPHSRYLKNVEWANIRMPTLGKEVIASLYI